MNHPAPHYLLRSEANQQNGVGRWRFTLTSADGQTHCEAADTEPNVWGDRLDLLTVVRALESLDQPSWVTLVGCSRYVEQGIQFGLSDWKENGWRWECFGRMVPVRDIDLWQRMDRILDIHQVDCLRRRAEPGHHQIEAPHWEHAKQRDSLLGGLAASKWVKYTVLATAACCGIGLKMTTWLRGSAADTRLAAASTRQ